MARAKSQQGERGESCYPPQAAHRVWGHDQAIEQFLNALEGGTMPHAWLITGAKGVGKATLAYAVARYMLAGAPKAAESQTGLFGEDSSERGSAASLIELDSSHPVSMQVMNESHPDLFVLRPNEEQGAATGILVDQVRKVEHFLAHTASSSSWRIIIIDTADQMNHNAANALLKSLEEPPVNVLFLLLATSAGAVLPTIRSRCRQLQLTPMSDMLQMQLVESLAPNTSQESIRAMMPFAEGAPGRLLTLITEEGEAMLNAMFTMLEHVPNIDNIAFRSWAALVVRKEAPERFGYAVEQIRTILRAIAQTELKVERVQTIPIPQSVTDYFLSEWGIDGIAELWEKLGQLSKEADQFNMDRKYALYHISLSLIKH